MDDEVESTPRNPFHESNPQMKARSQRLLLASTLLVGAVGMFAGCEPKGPAEKVGESIDQGARDVRDAIDPAGPAEKAGRAVDRSVNQ
jgi:hypothetical protein